MYSAFPTSAEIGMPFPRAFPKAARSGTTPYRSCAPPGASRNPVMISSKTMSAPAACARSRTPCKKPSSGSSAPTGSSTTAAVVPACRSRAASSDAEVVEQKGVGERPNCFRNTDRPRGRPDVPVLPAVIAAHDDAVPAGAGPREAHRRRRRIGAGLREPDAIRARHERGDPLCHLDLDRVRESEDDPVAQLALDRLAHRGMAVPEDDRAQRHREVEIPVAVDIPDMRALGARDVSRRNALHPLRGVLGERLRVGGDDALCALEQPRRLLEAPLDLHGSASRSSSTTRSTSDAARPGKIGSDSAPA